jgi:hypothetical protein
MKKTLLGACLLFCIVLAFRAVEYWASGIPGVYAIVEKVVFEPNAAAPERIQVWGVFAVTDGKPGQGYLQPQRGYLYFTLPPEERLELRQGTRVLSRPIALREWNDLKMMAGTESIAAFAARPSWTGRIRKATEKPSDPDVYPVHNGITQIPTQAQKPEIFRELQKAFKGK